MRTSDGTTGHSDEPWFADGLRFKCTGCGKCCVGSTGSVSLTKSDLERLAAFMHQPAGRFAQKYTRVVKGRRVLIDRVDSDDCIFLSDRSCTVYEGRPTQCRTFPWWVSSLQDQETWDETAEVCEGINHADAPVVPAHEISEQLAIDLANESALTVHRR